MDRCVLRQAKSYIYVYRQVMRQSVRELRRSTGESAVLLHGRVQRRFLLSPAPTSQSELKFEWLEEVGGRRLCLPN